MLSLIPQSEIKNIEEFLIPISPDSPCGPYLKRDPTLTRLKELRAIVLDTSSGMWKTKEKQGDTVSESIQLCENFLKTVSKDLFIVVYYVEALIKKYNFFGLDLGLSVLHALCETYWDKLNPGLDEEQAPLRVTAFKLLQTILMERLNLAAIVNVDSQQFTPFDVLKKEKGHEPTKVKNAIISALSKENADDLNLYKEKLQNSIHILDALTVRSDELNILLQNEDAPNFSKQVEILKLVLNLVTSALNPMALQLAVQETPSTTAAAGLQPTSGEVMNPNLNFPENPIQSIQDAYKMIGKINEFLLKNDSHSPCPALIQRAIEWREKPLFELYSDIFSGLSRPDELFTLLAIRPKPQPPQQPAQGPAQTAVPPSPAPSSTPSSTPSPYGGAGYSPAGGAGGYGAGYGGYGSAGYPSPYGGTTPGTPGYGGGAYGGDYGEGYPPPPTGGYNPYGGNKGGGGFG